MKVWELIEELKKFDQDLEVVKSKDDEGNSFHFVHTIDDDSYIRKDDTSRYYVEVTSAEDVTDYHNESLEDWTHVVVII